MNPVTTNLAAKAADLAAVQVVQVTLVAVGAAIAVALWGRRRPHLAYVLWMLVLLKCLTPPLWSSRAGLFSWSLARTVPAPVETVPDLELIPPSPMPPEGLPEAERPSDSPVEQHREPVSAWSLIPTALLSLWALGACTLGGMALWRWMGYWRMVRRGEPAAEGLQSMVAQLQRRLGVRRPVRVRVTGQPLSPAVFGVLRPVILLPRCVADRWSPAELEPILAHEVMHVRRWDPLAAVLQVAAQVLWWFHPLIWWANRHTTRERERCCDEQVVSGLRCRPRRYAESLLAVLESVRPAAAVFALPGVHPVQITVDRLEHIMKRNRRFHLRTPFWCWLLLAAGAVALLPGAGLSLEGATKDPGASPPPRQTDPPPTPELSDAEREADDALRSLGARIDRNDKGRVTLVGINSPQVNNGDLALLAKLRWSEPRVVDPPDSFVQPVPTPMLSLGGANITDDGLKHLGKLTNLGLLQISNTRITDAGLQHLRGLINLETLFLGKTISDRGLAHLKWLPRLRRLHLGGAAITNDGLEKHATGLAHLKRLFLSHTQITDDGMEHLKNLTNLLELGIDGTDVTDHGLIQLREMAHLELLYLAETKIGDAGLAHLEGLTSLKLLFLNDTSIGDMGLSRLKSLTDLRILFLTGTNITSAGLVHLNNLTKLTHLRLTDTDISDAGLVHLTQLRNLKDLNLEGTDVSDEAVDQLHEALPQCKITYDGGELPARTASVQANSGTLAQVTANSEIRESNTSHAEMAPASDAVANADRHTKALEELGAKIERNGDGEVISVQLTDRQLSVDDLAHLAKINWSDSVIEIESGYDLPSLALYSIISPTRI